MGERRNYYEIIDKLSFDPIEMRDKKIIDAIDLWNYNEAKKGLLCPNSDYEGQQEFDMYEDIKACLTDTERRKAEADAMKQKQMKKLNILIENMKKCGINSISRNELNGLARNLRLDGQKTVEKSLTEAGFNIIEKRSDNKHIYLISETVYKSLITCIDKINSMNTDNLSKLSWLSTFDDLYELAAFFKNDSNNKKQYSNKTAEELRNIMLEGAACFTGNLDSLSHLLLDLFYQGAHIVFKSEETKKQYDNTLRFDPLRKEMQIMSLLPISLKREQHICSYFVDKVANALECETSYALSLYNAEMKLSEYPADYLINGE